MDNGLKNCAQCSHYNSSEQGCKLRELPLSKPELTLCQNWNDPRVDPYGPLLLWVEEFKNGKKNYIPIPFDKEPPTYIIDEKHQTIISVMMDGIPLFTLVGVDGYLSYWIAEYGDDFMG